jgi:hypothetical protein
MIHRLLRHKVAHYDDYNIAYFERHLPEIFDIICCELLVSGTRLLYDAKLNAPAYNSAERERIENRR